MSSCKIATLYSGSSGNCTLISSHNTSILIDAGGSARAICSALENVGSDIRDISAIFITHEHTDHISALCGISKKYSIPIHITDISAQKPASMGELSLDKCLCRHNTVFCQMVGDIKVTSFPTPHDSMMSVGYRIEIGSGDKHYTIGVATDIGHVTPQIREGLLGCCAVVLESNHDQDMLRNGPYPQFLKKRILSPKGHLSNEDSAELSSYLAKNGTRAFILAHLSRENNLPELAYDVHVSSISDSSVTVCVAKPDCPVELLLS